jgi:U3 small nucleolar RNA-associated protein 6
MYVVVLRNVAPKAANCFQWRDVGRLFESLNAEDQVSWCIEQNKSNSPDPRPSAFLSPLVTQDRAYCSFLVQKDAVHYEAVLQQLPFTKVKGAECYYEKALWIFFGRNPLGHAALTGRPEHTDSVSHDGTWHYQLSGSKEWYIRPSSQLLELWRKEGKESSFSLGNDTEFHIVCDEGDVIMINTRLWFHRTELPASIVPSVSFARDFRWHGPSHHDGGMTNVDGLYATEDIEAGTIVFTEKDMPDCELHRSSTNPNCEVVELEDGTGAIAALRNIQAGEFFCIAESDDDGDDDDNEEEEEEDDDEECE